MDKKLKLLNGLCAAISFLGWLLIIGGFFWGANFVNNCYAEESSEWSQIQFIFYVISKVSFDFLFVGISAIVVAGFVKFIVNKESRAGSLLRFSDKLFYIFAGLGILWALIQHSVFKAVIADTTARILYEQPVLLPALLKAIMLILLGRILKSLLPVIEEYKSLV